MKPTFEIKRTERGSQYIESYEVRAIKDWGNTTNYTFCLTEEQAKKEVDFIHEEMQDLYVGAFYTKILIWL